MCAMFCPLFFSTIVCDLIFDGGSYLQFALAHDDNDGGDGDDDERKDLLNRVARPVRGTKVLSPTASSWSLAWPRALETAW